jgi:hypothetical protein
MFESLYLNESKQNIKWEINITPVFFILIIFEMVAKQNEMTLGQRLRISKETNFKNVILNNFTHTHKKIPSID